MDGIDARSFDAWLTTNRFEEAAEAEWAAFETWAEDNLDLDWDNDEVVNKAHDDWVVLYESWAEAAAERDAEDRRDRDRWEDPPHHWEP